MWREEIKEDVVDGGVTYNMMMVGLNGVVELEKPTLDR